MSNPITNPWTKPFRSGSGMCYPSTDYVKHVGAGKKRDRGRGRGRRQRGGNPTTVQLALSAPSQPSDLTGNGFGAADQADALTGSGVHVPASPMTEGFKQTNMGLNWATNGGAKKTTKKRKATKKTTKKRSKSPAKKRKSPAKKRTVKKTKTPKRKSPTKKRKATKKSTKKVGMRGRSKTRQRGGVTPLPLRYFNPNDVSTIICYY